MFPYNVDKNPGKYCSYEFLILQSLLNIGIKGKNNVESCSKMEFRYFYIPSLLYFYLRKPGLIFETLPRFKLPLVKYHFTNVL